MGLAILHLEKESGKGATFRILEANSGAADFLGGAPALLIGKTLDQLPGPALTKFTHLYKELLKTKRKKPKILKEFPHGNVRDRGTVYSMRAFSLPNQCIGLVFEGSTERTRRVEAQQNTTATKGVGVCVQEWAGKLSASNDEFQAQVAKRRRMEDQLRDALEELHELAARLMSVREEERARVARAMHDELGQAYTALRMDVSWIEQRLPVSEISLRERTAIMRKLIDETIVRMRRIATELRPSTLDELGLADAIEWQAQEFQAHSGIPCRVRVPKDELSLDEQCSTALFRIFQEALTNVARHARATEVRAELIKHANRLTLVVRDNGRGFEEMRGNGTKSLGLLGMRERTLLVSGKFSIRGAAGKGTVVKVSVPLDSEPERENRK